MNNYSLAIFGSSLRTDFDQYSDKDLLIVAKDNKSLKRLGNHFEEGEWSASYYTYSKLKHLAQHGSLFVKHLQLESKILTDYNNQLSEILNEFNEKNSYEKDIHNTIKYFDILEFIPNSRLGLLWFCDCFFVGLRNHLIFLNASDGIFEFSFSGLLKILIEQRKIEQKEASKLSELRVLKRKYREGDFHVSPSIEYVNSIVEVGKKLNFLNSPTFIQTDTYKSLIEEDYFAKDLEPYHRLRLIEGYYCAFETEMPEIKRIICNPQFYAQKFKDTTFVSKLVNKIKLNGSKQTLSSISLLSHLQRQV